MADTLKRDSLGIAVIGAGRIGTMRARLAAQHPAVNFIAVADLKQDAAQA
jgi:glyceraldehyde-3-phosphate dehydrogenase/erythrose-4-phosphate dehydrogenase